MRIPLSTIIPAGIAILAVIAVIFVALVSSGGSIAILDPAGIIADKQRTLLFVTFGLMLLVVIPVFFLAFFFAWKYRAGNTKAEYQPEWEGSKKLELTWWGVPFAIIAVLAIIAWTTSHTLEPSRAIQSDKQPVTIQVVALRWKWLFLYPEQQVATVNRVYMPAGRPVEFQITADAPMNSFWIPRLGGQLYAMSGMVTSLNLQADHPGSYFGTSANISGEGSSRMNFTAEAMTDTDFKAWAESAKTSSNVLSVSSYTALSRPAAVDKPIEYASYESDLFDSILAKFNSPHASHSTNQSELPAATVQRLLAE